MGAHDDARQGRLHVVNHRIREVIAQFRHLFLFGDEAQQLDDDDGEEAENDGADEEERTEASAQFGVGVVEGEADGSRTVATDADGLRQKRPR